MKLLVLYKDACTHCLLRLAPPCWYISLVCGQCNVWPLYHLNSLGPKFIWKDLGPLLDSCYFTLKVTNLFLRADILLQEMQCNHLLHKAHENFLCHQVAHQSCIFAFCNSFCACLRFQSEWNVAWDCDQCNMQWGAALQGLNLFTI